MEAVNLYEVISLTILFLTKTTVVILKMLFYLYVTQATRVFLFNLLNIFFRLDDYAAL